MAATIVVGSVSLASDGITFTGTLSGGSGSGYTPATGVVNFSVTVAGVARNLCSSTISGTTWTGIAYTPIVGGATVTVVAVTGSGTVSSSGMSYLSDSGSNTATAQSVAVTNNSTKSTGDVTAALRSKPGSWDTTWDAARAASGTVLAEAVVIGDSTSFGSGASANNSWVYELRRLSILAGFVDGGIGQLQAGQDNATHTGPVEALAPIASGAWSGAANTYGPGIYGGIESGSAQTVVVQGRGTRIRLYYARFNNTGDFTYAVDGGAATTVAAWATGAPDTGIVDITGLSDGVHQITMVNVASRAQPTPLFNGTPDNSGSAPFSTVLANATYTYAVTGIDGSGNETLATVTNPMTVDAAKRQPNISIFNDTAGAIVSYRYYRNNGGGYELVTTIARSGSYNNFGDDGTITPTAGTPPVTATLTRDTYPANAAVGFDFIRSAGVTFHKNAVSGAVWNGFGLEGSYNNWPYQCALGLTHASSSVTPNSRPPWRDPKLSVAAIGINHQQFGATDTTPYVTGLTNWSAASNGAGATRLIIIPHYSRSNSFTTGKAFVDAAKSYATTNGLAWIDFNVVLDLAGYSTGSDPHLAQTGYDAEAQAVWDNMLTAAAPSTGGPLQASMFMGV